LDRLSAAIDRGDEAGEASSGRLRASPVIPGDGVLEDFGAAGGLSAAG